MPDLPLPIPSADTLPKDGGLSRPAALAIAVAVLGASALIGRRNAPDRSHPRIRRWYQRLDKPGFVPPDAVFGAVWPLLKTGLAVGGYRLLRQPATAPRNAALGLWLINGALIGGWSDLFFRRRALGPSAALWGAMVVTGTAHAVAAARRDRVAGALALPLLAWLGFATVMATDIWRRARRGSDD
ncbi:TspO/MBR family protein [Sphingomonas montanisoli]|uniref:TspO/MBR family protein n=1 Tax=Sphingomonas montanisoli TaxID=2606412 RepID=UPI001FEB77FC|nr:TspO/MBR family protein [Sphingomonas montanisoli]